MQTYALSDKEITNASYAASAEQFAQNVSELAPISSIDRFLALPPPKAKIIGIGYGSRRDAKLSIS